MNYATTIQIIEEEFARAKKIYNPEEFHRRETMNLTLGSMEARIKHRLEIEASK